MQEPPAPRHWTDAAVTGFLVALALLLFLSERPRWRPHGPARAVGAGTFYGGF